MKYVLGIAFNRRLKQIALIRKDRPEWQRGLLNGIGGKIEPGEAPMRAMQREFKEETGCTIKVPWCLFAIITGTPKEDYVLYCYCVNCYFDLTKHLATTTDEEILIRKMRSGRIEDNMNIVSNLNWLIPMAYYHYDRHLVHKIEEGRIV